MDFGPVIMFVVLHNTWKLVFEEGSELAMAERTPLV